MRYPKNVKQGQKAIWAMQGLNKFPNFINIYTIIHTDFKYFIYNANKITKDTYFDVDIATL